MWCSRQQKLHCSERRWYSTARITARSTPPAADHHRAPGTALPNCSSSSWGCEASRGPGLPFRRSALGHSAPWTSKDLYSFSSGPWLGSESRELLIARSSEQPENGWLSILDTRVPGLLSSGPEHTFPELLPLQGELSPMVTVGVEARGVSLTLFPLEGIMLVGTLVGTMVVVGTLDGIALARVELMGNLDGAGLVSTLEGIVPGGFMLVGNLEGPELTSAELAGTLEGSELVVVELAGTSASLEQMVVLVWSPDPSTEAKVVEEEGPADGRADTAGPGKWLALGVERARGWKETVGDTGPRVGVGLETAPAIWVPPSSGSCSCCLPEVRGLRPTGLEEGSKEPPGLLRTALDLGVCGAGSEPSSGDFGGCVSWTGKG